MVKYRLLNSSFFYYCLCFFIGPIFKLIFLALFTNQFRPVFSFFSGPSPAETACKPVPPFTHHSLLVSRTPAPAFPKANSFPCSMAMHRDHQLAMPSLHAAMNQGHLLSRTKTALIEGLLDKQPPSNRQPQPTIFSKLSMTSRAKKTWTTSLPFKALMTCSSGVYFSMAVKELERMTILKNINS